jgi:anthraniloyl-CoA monooxygenase
MRIVCIGGGPAGLYFSILAKLDGNHDVTVIERNPDGVTYGWGVVFWDDLLDDLFRKDPVSARQIWESAARWDEYEVRVQGKRTTYLGGYGFSMGRHRLLAILAARAAALGVDIRLQDEVEDLSRFADADLIVACDGANSGIRRLYEKHFGTDVDTGRNKYIWLGTPKVFDTFTFGFEQTDAGWLWYHAYPFDSGTSTFIVECQPETWLGLGFDTLDPDESIALLERVFARHLDGRPLINQLRGLGTTPWLNFKRVTNETWHYENVVLMGDAAHTTHFAIGSGTKLAMQDAIGLAEKLHDSTSLDAALKAYEDERRSALGPLQRAAQSSSRWFEEVPRYTDQDATQFAYSLSNRRGEYPLWRYLLHLSVQWTPVRTMLRWGLSGRKWARSRRRSASAGPIMA